MRGLLPVFKRELTGYFITPVAYVFIVIFLVLAGVFTFQIGNWYENNQADLRVFFSSHPWLYMFLIPALSMRLWAEERKSGTIELLLTLPVSRAGAVLGKFLAAWAFTVLALTLTFPLWLTVNYLGMPAGGVKDLLPGIAMLVIVASAVVGGLCLLMWDGMHRAKRGIALVVVAGVALSLALMLPGRSSGGVDNGVILAGYLGSALMAGAFIAIGAAVSASTKSQVIAFIITIVICFMFLLAGFPPVLDFFKSWAPSSVVDTVAGFSFLTRFESIGKGLIDLRDIVYFVTLIAACLAANLIIIEAKKAA